MEIKVSKIESVKEIIISAKKTADEYCLEELSVCHPAVSVTITYGKHKRSILIDILDKNTKMKWENGEISINEIIKFIDETTSDM